MESSWLAGTWKVLVARGVVAIALGVVVLAWPKPTLVVIVVLWGIWALLDGISSLTQAFRPGPTSSRVLAGVIGVVALVAAAFAIFRPVDMATVLAWFLGIWLIVRGVMDLLLSVSRQAPSPRWPLVLVALVDLVLGILFVTHPDRSAVGIAWLLGLLTVAWGLLFLLVGLMARRAEKQLASAVEGS